MYHSRWKKDHYSAGFAYGNRLRENNVKIDFKEFLTDKKLEYGKEALSIYQRYYSDIIQEIQGFADGQKAGFNEVFSFLVGMYVFTYGTYCSMFAISNKNGFYFARNSDFKTEIEKLSDSAFYALDTGYSFIGNTTAMIQVEDGINEEGLACGLTFVYPTVKDKGFNAGFLVRYILEKCKTVEEVKDFLENVPIGSSQNIIAIDKKGKILSAELNSKCKNIEICKNAYKSNHFISEKLKPYQYNGEDDIFSHERYQTLEKQNFNEYVLDDIFALLRGDNGFMCQYDRKRGFDTIWSSVYDIGNKTIYRCEGNPCRKKYKIDERLEFKC